MTTFDLNARPDALIRDITNPSATRREVVFQPLRSCRSLDSGDCLTATLEAPAWARSVVVMQTTPDPSAGHHLALEVGALDLVSIGAPLPLYPTGPLDINGATVQVSPIATADSVKSAVKSFTGNINGQPLAGITEVETSARVSSYDLMKITNTSDLVTDYRLEQNYPNPFNPSTQIRFSLPKAQNVTLEVFDVTGKSVALLISGRVEAGNNSIPFIARDLPSGMYLYILSGRDFSLSRKMILLK